MNSFRFRAFFCKHPTSGVNSCWWRGAFLIFLLAFSVISRADGAQEPRILTLDESIEVAKKNNLTVQTAAQNLKTAAAQVRAARAGLLPRLTASGDYTYFRDVQRSVIQAEGGFGFLPPGAGDGMQPTPTPSADDEAELIELEFGAHHNLQGTVSLTQPVFAWGRYYYDYQAAKLRYQAEVNMLSSAYHQLRLDVSEAFYGVLVAQEFVRVAQQSVGLVEKQLGVAEASFEAGAATDFDVLRAKVQLANAQSQRIRAENGVKIAKNGYKTLLNLPLSEDISVQGSLETVGEPSLEAISLETLIHEALKSRPEVNRSQLNERAARKQVDVAKTRRLPELSFFSNYQISQNERLTQMNRIWSLGLRINVPIFDGFATAAAVQQTESVLKQTELGSAQLASAVEFEVRSAYLNLLEARTLIEVQRETVAQARESVRIANLQFENGIITTVALTDTQLALAQAEVNRLQAHHDYIVGLARLEKAIGSSVFLLFARRSDR